MAARRRNAHLAAVLLAFAVAFVAGGALAHELDHQLNKQDVPCALHLYAGHLDGIATAGVSPATAPAASAGLVIPTTAVLPRRPLAPYAVRAPPSFSCG